MPRMQIPNRARRIAAALLALAAGAALAGCAGDDGARPLPSPEGAADAAAVEQRFDDYAAAHGYRVIASATLATSAESALPLDELDGEPLAFGVHCDGLGADGSATVSVGGTVVEIPCDGTTIDETAFAAAPPAGTDGAQGLAIAIVGSTGIDGRLTVAVYSAD